METRLVMKRPDELTPPERKQLARLGIKRGQIRAELVEQCRQFKRVDGSRSPIGLDDASLYAIKIMRTSRVCMVVDTATDKILGWGMYFHKVRKRWQRDLWASQDPYIELYVQHAYRRRGFGRKILESLLKVSDACGTRDTVMVYKPDAHQLMMFAPKDKNGWYVPRHNLFKNYKVKSVF